MMNCRVDAVLLLVRSRPGPKLVFYYPPTTDAVSTSNDAFAEIAGDANTSSTEPDHEQDYNASSCHRYLDQTIEGLEKLLSPGNWCDQQKFETRLADYTFFGHPIFAHDDGQWGEKSPGSPPQTENTLVTAQHNTQASAIPFGAHKSISDDFMHIPESVDSRRGIGLSTSMDSNSDSPGPASEQILMFNVVLAMRSHGSGDTDIAQNLYDAVIRTLSRALHYCQKTSRYITNEVKLISAIKSKAKQAKQSQHGLWAQIIESSELAWALKQLYESLNEGLIANLRLGGTSISLPLEIHPARKVRARLTPSAALLLLDDKENILRELAYPETSPLLVFIHGHTPTKSLSKHATNLGIPLRDVVYLADHLILWRRARIIAPLHQRNFYTTSKAHKRPNIADMESEFSLKFPTLPSLATMLRHLSAKPVRYAALVPSRDHRGPYLDMLAYMLRHDLVMQLKSYGWLQLPTVTLKALPANLIEGAKPAHNLPGPYSHLADDDDAASVSSAATTVLMSAKHPPPRSFPPLSITSHDETNGMRIVSEPNNLNHTLLEALELVKDQYLDEVQRDLLPNLLPFLNGKTALEEIAGKLGLKRANVDECLSALEKSGHLVVSRVMPSTDSI